MNTSKNPSHSHPTQGRVVVLTTQPPLPPLSHQDRASAGDLPEPTLDEVQVQALALLKCGQGIGQVATTLGISGHMVRRWINWTGTAPSGDGRRWYDDGFKANALAQLQGGVSVRKLARQLSISEVTLHKWKKELIVGQAQYPELFFQAESQPGPTGVSNMANGVTASLTDQLASLQGQVQALTLERDVLKKALVILLRSDSCDQG